MDELNCEVLVIGGGPGGYVCAIRAGQLGLDTILVEAGELGGACLNVGCIPSKALIHVADEFAKAATHAKGGVTGITVGAPKFDMAQAVKWKDAIVGRLTGGVGALLRKARVRHVQGFAHMVDGKTVDVDTALGAQRIRAKNVVIATGSRSVELPNLPFGGDVISSTEALALRKLPKKLAVVGGGYIGLEIGTAFAKLGAEVTIVELAERILPLYDAELTKPVARRLEECGIKVMTDAKAVASEGGGLKIEIRGGTQLIPADKILVTVGRAPATDGWGIEELNLEMDGRHISIDEQCRTSMRGVFAIGDVTGEPMLAHRAMAQGALAAGVIAGSGARWCNEAIPAVCFTDPEIVSVGLLPHEAESRGIETITGQFPFSANGRAMTMETEDGFIRVISRKSDGLVLGIQAVGAGISELSSAFTLAIEMGATTEDIAATIHAHPTLGEIFQEASLRQLGRALHI